MKLGRADAYYQETKFGRRVTPAIATTIPYFQGKTEWGYINVPVRVDGWDDYKMKFGEYVTGAYLTHVVKSFFTAGGRICYVMSMKSSTTGDVPTQSSAEISDASLKTGDVYFLYPCVAGDEFSVEFRDIDDEPNYFEMVVKRNGNILPQGGVFGPLSKSSTNAAFWENVINKYNTDGELINELGSDHVYIVDDSGNANQPQKDTNVPLTGGDDGLESVEADYVGVQENLTGLYGILPIRDRIDFITNTELFTDSYITSLATFGAAHNIPVVIDFPRDTSAGVARVKGVALKQKDYGEDDEDYPIDPDEIDLNDYINSFIKVVYPWKKVLDPTKINGDLLSIPAAGFEIGGYCSQDAQNISGNMHLGRNLPISNTRFGNFTNAGVMGLQYTIDEELGAYLLKAHVNETRRFLDANDISSYMAWGERSASQDIDYKFFPNRRMLTWIQKDLLVIGRTFVFSPQTEGFLATLENAVRSRLQSMLDNSEGIFYSKDFEQSIYLRCDDPALNTPASLAKDQAYCEVGVRLARMVEFIIFKVGYFQGGAQLV